MIGGSGIIVSGIGGAALLRTNYQSGTIISVAVYVLLALALWGGLYWYVLPFLKRVPKE